MIFARLKTAPHYTWITNTWEYASSLESTVTTPTIQLYPQYQYDTTIMQLTYVNYRGIQHKIVNAVRRFLQVFYISDTTISDDCNICLTFLKPTSKQN